jgi:hypothetical protein
LQDTFQRRCRRAAGNKYAIDARAQIEQHRFNRQRGYIQDVEEAFARQQAEGDDDHQQHIAQPQIELLARQNHQHRGLRLRRRSVAWPRYIKAID